MPGWTESMDGSKSCVRLEADGFEEVDLDGIYMGLGGGIVFQHGPVQEAGVNGTTIETVIGVLINRLEGFQRGAFRNGYNADAITHLKIAKQRLLDRTRDRQARGVEGVNAV